MTGGNMLGNHHHHYSHNQVRHLCGILTRHLCHDDCCRYPWPAWEHHGNSRSIQVDDDDYDEKGDDDDDHDGISGFKRKEEKQINGHCANPRCSSISMRIIMLSLFSDDKSAKS